MVYICHNLLKIHPWAMNLSGSSKGVSIVSTFVILLLKIRPPLTQLVKQVRRYKTWTLDWTVDWIMDSILESILDNSVLALPFGLPNELVIIQIPYGVFQHLCQHLVQTMRWERARDWVWSHKPHPFRRVWFVRKEAEWWIVGVSLKQCAASLTTHNPESPFTDYT